MVIVLALLAGLLWSQADSPMVVTQRVFEQDEDGSNTVLIESFQIGDCDEQGIDTFAQPVTTYCDRIVIRPPPLPDKIYGDGFE